MTETGVCAAVEIPPKKLGLKLRQDWPLMLFCNSSMVFKLFLISSEKANDYISYFSLTLGISVKLEGILLTFMP